MHDTRPVVTIDVDQRSPAPEVDISPPSAARWGLVASVIVAVAAVVLVVVLVLSRGDGGSAEQDAVDDLRAAISSGSDGALRGSLLAPGTSSGFSDVAVVLERLADGGADVEGVIAALDLRVANPTGDAEIVGGGDRRFVRRSDGSALVSIGRFELVDVDVVDQGDGWRVDLFASALRAAATGASSTVDPAAGTSAVDAAGLSFLSSLAADTRLLLPVVDPVREGVLLEQPGGAAVMLNAWRSDDRRVRVEEVEFSRQIELADGALAVEVQSARLTVVSPTGEDEVVYREGCLVSATVPCDRVGLATIGTLFPRSVVVVERPGGWFAQPLRTSYLVLASLAGSGAADEAASAVDQWLNRWLGTESIRTIERPSLPLDPAAAPPSTVPSTSTAPAPSTSAPTAGLESVVDVFDPTWLSLDLPQGVIGSQDLAALGFVPSAADLDDFGFRDAAMRAMVSPDGVSGALVLVIGWSDGSAAAAEFETYYGRALIGAGRAAFGPGDFSGPTDRGPVAQYRTVALSGRFHVAVETWGPTGDLESRAASLSSTIEARLG